MVSSQTTGRSLRNDRSFVSIRIHDGLLKGMNVYEKARMMWIGHSCGYLDLLNLEKKHSHLTCCLQPHGQYTSRHKDDPGSKMPFLSLQATFRSIISIPQTAFPPQEPCHLLLHRLLILTLFLHLNTAALLQPFNPVLHLQRPAAKPSQFRPHPLNHTHSLVVHDLQLRDLVLLITLTPLLALVGFVLPPRCSFFVEEVEEGQDCAEGGEEGVAGACVGCIRRCLVVGGGGCGRGRRRVAAVAEGGEFVVGGVDLLVQVFDQGFEGFGPALAFGDCAQEAELTHLCLWLGWVGWLVGGCDVLVLWWARVPVGGDWGFMEGDRCWGSERR